MSELAEIRLHDEMAIEDDVIVTDWVSMSSAMQKQLYLEAARDRHILLAELDRLRAGVFESVRQELENVRALSIFYDKPGLGTALAVVRNTEEAMRLGLM